MPTDRPLLVATDLSDRGRHAVTTAAKWARDFDVPLAIVNVIDEMPNDLLGAGLGGLRFDPLEVGQMAHDATRSALEDDVAELGLDDLAPDLYVRMGHPVEEILDTAGECDARIVVMGRTGAGALESMLMGGTASKLMRHADRPVALVPATGVEAPRRVLVPIDFGPNVETQLDFVQGLGLPPAARLVLLSVTAMPAYFTDVVGDALVRTELVRQMTQEYRTLIETRANELAEAGFVVEHEVVEGDATAEILAAAERHRSDTIVIGTRGRRGIARALIGNTAEKVARRFAHTTLVVPAPRRD